MGSLSDAYRGSREWREHFEEDEDMVMPFGQQCCSKCGYKQCVCHLNPGILGNDPIELYKEVRDKQVAKEAKENTTKETNPKDAIGIKKVPISTVSNAVMMELGLAMMEGALKYGRHNYRVSGVRGSVYWDALWRHMTAWWEFSQDNDPDSGVHHITKAIACLMVLRDSQLLGNWVDDRPPPMPIELLEEYNKLAAALIKKYPNPKKAFVRSDAVVPQCPLCGPAECSCQ